MICSIRAFAVYPADPVISRCILGSRPTSLLDCSLQEEDEGAIQLVFTIDDRLTFHYNYNGQSRCILKH